MLCFLPLSHGCELRLCRAVVPRAPPDGLRWVVGCWPQQLARYPRGWAPLFCFTPRSARSHPRLLAQRSGIPHLGASHVFSLFAYYNTLGPASSDRKVKSPPPREYRRSWRLARLIAERCTPVLVRAAGPVPGTAGGCPCACVGRVPWGCLSLTRCPRAVGHPPHCPAGAGGCCRGWGSFAWSCSSGLVLVRGRG